MKRIKSFFVECAYLAIKRYAKEHHFALRGTIDVVPMTHEEYRKHLEKVFAGNQECVKDYLDTTPIG